MSSHWIGIFCFFSSHLFAQTSSSERITVAQLNQRAEYFIFSQPDSSFIYATRALKVAKDQNDLLEQGSSHELIGRVFYYQAVYLQALEHLLQAESIFRDLNDKSRMADCLNQLGLVYYNIRQSDQALASHEAALKYYTSADNKKGIAYSLGCIGRLLEKKQEYTAALSYQQKALSMYESLRDEQGIATILENIGSIYEDLEKYDESLSYFRQSLRLNEFTRDSLSMVINLNNIGDNYRKTGNYEMALLFTKKALALSQRLNYRDQISSAYKDLSKTYHLSNNDKLAYENLELGRTLYEEIFAHDASRQLALLHTLFETEQNNNAIQQLHQAQKLDTVIKISLLTGLGLVGLLGGVTISRQRLKIRKDRERSIRDNEVHEANAKLMQAEIENTHLREQTLTQELEAQNKSLSTHTLHLVGKNKMLEDIQLKLNELLSVDREEQRKKIKGLIKMIDRNFVQDKDWEDFSRIFGQVHKDFFEKLSHRTPDLTASDLRLAALIRLHLTSKDISSTLGISSDSLRIARYRLKKKLKLEEGQSLTAFIHSMH